MTAVSYESLTVCRLTVYENRTRNEKTISAQRVMIVFRREPSPNKWISLTPTHSSGTPQCQVLVRVGVLECLVAGPGSDLSEVPAVGIGLAALDCRVAPRCPPGPVAIALVSLTMHW